MLDLDRSTKEEVLAAIDRGARVEDVCDMLGCTTYAYYYNIRPENPEFDRRIRETLQERDAPVPEDEDTPIWMDGTETPEETTRRAEILKTIRSHSITQY